jgi:hypothetical protein
MSKVYVYLWFDIEDYVTKEADDPALIFIDIAKRNHVPVTCKLVAEEVRALIERDRHDVIDAISSCDVGYHSDTHSQHPTVWEYLAELDVFLGAKEFRSREERGLRLMREVFHRTPSCYGHPGVMWAPHTYPALVEMGIFTYLDETRILSLDDEPYWYCGILNLNGAGKNCLYFDYSFEKPDGILTIESKFKKIYDRLSKGNGGAISICLHPHTAVNKIVWDVVNFSRGRNRTKEEYVRPPAQPSKVTKRAYEHFERFLQYISSFKNVQWITATDAAKIYQQPMNAVNSKSELGRITKHFLSSSSYMRYNGNNLSPAEAFFIITTALSKYADTGDLPDRIDVKEPLGPISSFRSTGVKRFDTTDFLAATKSSSIYVNTQNSIPTHISVGESELSPQDFLSTACRLLISILEGKVRRKIALKRGNRPQVDRLSKADFAEYCRWAVLPRGFKAPKIFEQACLQAWTLKPAVPTVMK